MPVDLHPPRPVNTRPVQTAEPYPAEKARGAEIIFHKPWQPLVFIGGLLGVFVLVVALRLIAMASS